MKKKNKFDNWTSRCKACDALLDNFTRARKLPNGDFEDLCTKCKGASYIYNFRFTDYTCEGSVDGDCTQALPSCD